MAHREGKGICVTGRPDLSPPPSWGPARKFRLWPFPGKKWSWGWGQFAVLVTGPSCCCSGGGDREGPKRSGGVEGLRLIPTTQAWLGA